MLTALYSKNHKGNITLITCTGRVGTIEIIDGNLLSEWYAMQIHGEMIHDALWEELGSGKLYHYSWEGQTEITREHLDHLCQQFTSEPIELIQTDRAGMFEWFKEVRNRFEVKEALETALNKLQPVISLADEVELDFSDYVKGDPFANIAQLIAALERGEKIN